MIPHPEPAPEPTLRLSRPSVPWRRLRWRGRRLLRTLAWLLALPAAAGFAASPYDFFTVAPAQGQITILTSPNGRGTIKVTTSISGLGAGPSNNVHSALNKSTSFFPVLFPGTGPVQGHLTQVMYGGNVTVIYDLTGYQAGPDTVFGLWNMTDEVPTNPPPYRLELRDASFSPMAPPFSWKVMGNDENAQLVGTSVMNLDPATGKFVNPSKGGATGGHSNAQFWTSLPPAAKYIVLYGALPRPANVANNSDGDGVGSYFAELHGSFKFDCGMTVVTCYSDAKANQFTDQCYNTGKSDPNGFVVAILNTALPPPSSPASIWTAVQTSGFHNDFGPALHQFRQRNLGEVFGVTLDRQSPPNIYVAATSLYSGDGAGPAGFGGVYKINGSTFNITPLISLSGVGSVSLGSLCFDPANNQLLVADLDNGLIRRVAVPAGTESPGPYDHGISAAVPPVPNVPKAPGDVTQPGRRMFGVQVRGGRLYYSLYTTNVTTPCSAATEIWSVGLNPASSPPGAFITSGPGGPTLEYVVPNPNCYNPGEVWVTDIAFAQDGRMLLAERGVCTTTPTNLATDAHHSRVIELVKSGSNWIPTALNPIRVGVGTQRNSAGGIDYTCDDAMVIMADAIAAPGGWLPPPYQNQYVYGVQYNPAGTTGVTNAYVIDLNNNTTSWDKSFLGALEVQRCCECLEFSGEQTECTATNTFTWTFCAQNTGTLTNGHFVFLDLPAGVTVTPQIMNLSPSLKPGDRICTNVTFTVDPKLATNRLCFRIAAHTPDFEDCCVVSKCLNLPECCGLIPREDVKCDPAGGGVTWTLQLANNSGTPVKYAYVIPDVPSCVSASPNLLVLNPPLPNGGSTNLTVTLAVTNSPCDVACFTIALHDTNFVACCAFTHCVKLVCPGQGENHPPTIDCPPPHQTVCDPAAGQGYTIGAGVQDPDGDPLTVIWKVNGNPVKTVTIPAGASASSTGVQLVQNYPPGSYTITLCVTDGHGTPVICTTQLDVGDTEPPKIQCPPDLVVDAWEYTVPDFTHVAVVEDNCTPIGSIKVTQSPPPGTVVTNSQNCIQVVATDAAGNVATCTTCITLSPVHLTITGGATTVFGVVGAFAPATLALSVTGDVAGTAAVEYFVGGKSIGLGVAPGFRLDWKSVPAGLYSVVATATRRAAPSTRLSTLPVQVEVIPPAATAGGAVIANPSVEGGQLTVFLPTSAGARTVLEGTDSLESDRWQVLYEMTGDGETHIVTVETRGPSRFVRLRIDR